MTTRHAVAAAFGISLLLIGVSSARAGDGPLDQVGGVCVPDSATVRAGLYETRGFGVGFSGNSTGKIRLLCPFNVTASMLGAKIGITFLNVIDDDGMQTGARVSATFRHSKLASNVAVTNGTCDSNSSSFPGPHNVSCTFPAYTIKINESYWWDVLIERTNPRVNVEFLSVGMRYLGSDPLSRGEVPGPALILGALLLAGVVAALAVAAGLLLGRSVPAAAPGGRWRWRWCLLGPTSLPWGHWRRRARSPGAP